MEMAEVGLHRVSGFSHASVLKLDFHSIFPHSKLDQLLSEMCCFGSWCFLFKAVSPYFCIWIDPRLIIKLSLSTQSEHVPKLHYSSQPTLSFFSFWKFSLIDFFILAEALPQRLMDSMEKMKDQEKVMKKTRSGRGWSLTNREGNWDPSPLQESSSLKGRPWNAARKWVANAVA